MKRILFIFIVLLALAGAGGSWWWVRQSLPPYDGEERTSGLVAPVEILFDAHGVPHVYAAALEDAWLAAGALHARERLWQMELYRRAANGRLSEVLGERTLPIDKRLLTLGLKAAAEAEWQAAQPAVRLALTRYAEGVNGHIARTTGRLRPLEFQFLRFDPAPWTPVDSLVIGRLLAWRLAENHQSELVRAGLMARFGLVEAQRLAGAYPGDAPTILGAPAPSALTSLGGQASPAGLASLAGPASPAGTLASLGKGVAAAEDSWPHGLEWLRPGARRGNSNNFVVSGQRTATGRPILGNDPHLQIEFPGVWYEMHLVAKGLDVIGVTLPGAPFVILGHNARIAWGMTNTAADVQDLYVERVDLERKRYNYQGQWLPIASERADIPVRGRASEPFEIWRTRHGPIFADAGLAWEEPPGWLSPNAERAGERRAFALKWDVSGEIAGAFEALDRASDWTEFVAAVERFTAPSQNFVFADVDGNIGYAMSGVLPVRASGNGTTPPDGTSGSGEWVGRVNPATLPRAFNPPAGYVASSNNEVDRRWNGLITRDWAAPFRATRLNQIVAGGDKLDLARAKEVQNDVSSQAAERVLKGIDQAIAAGKSSGASEVAMRALDQLRAWDRRLDARPVAALYVAFEDAIWRRTFADEMGQELFDKFYEWAGAERPAGLYVILDEANARWFDDIGTIDKRENRHDIYVLAARDAVERLERDHGRQDSWDWSQIHGARFSHPLGAGALPLRWLFDRGPSPVGGDIYTVMRVSYNRMRPFAAYEIPSWRQLFDVGQWDDAAVILPGGQSGHPLSPHYFDQNELWRRGQTRPQPFSRAAVDRARAHRLLLLP